MNNNYLDDPEDNDQLQNELSRLSRVHVEEPKGIDNVHPVKLIFLSFSFIFVIWSVVAGVAGIISDAVVGAILAALALLNLVLMIGLKDE